MSVPIFIKSIKTCFNLDRIYVPTSKIESRCRFWIACKHVVATVRLVPCSWGCINDSLILEINVFLCVNLEIENPGKEDGDEQALVNDHG